MGNKIGVAMQALHFFLATTVTQQTPENWIWFSTSIPGFMFIGRAADFLIAKLPPRKRRTNRGRRAFPFTKGY